MPLTHDQLEQLRQQLEQRRAELEEQAAADPINRDEMPIADQEFSPADAATNRLLTDLALGDAGRHLSQLALVRNALTRLQARRNRPIGAFAVDYFQLMTMLKERGESDAAAYKRMTMELKRIAKEFNCTSILLSQLKRDVEARENKRPNLGDLKETSGLEEDADYVLFPFRPHYYEVQAGMKPKIDVDDLGFAERLKKIENDMIVGIAKARDDFAGDVHMFCEMGFDVVRNI